MFEGNGLFVFSDPAAAKSVLSFIVKNKKSFKSITIISDRVYCFYENFEFNVLFVKKITEEFLLSVKPNFIFTGTSYTSKIELETLIVAHKLSISTFSFVDHWTSIKERFKYQNEYVYPEIIFVLDEKAKSIAIQEGIDFSILKIMANPYLDFLKKWTPSCNRVDFLKKIGIHDLNKKLIVYAPEPLSNVGGKERFGFDEIQMTKEFNKIVQDNDFNHNFVLKLHPNQNKNDLENVIGEKILIIDSSIDSNTLIFYADVVIGFFSNFLIEAHIMNKRVIRFFPDTLKFDPLSDKSIGEIINIKNLKSELELNYER